MGIYTRFKKAPDGFRKLVELLESTPSDRRKKMIDAGMVEDEDYTQLAIRCMMTMGDIIEAPDMELAEIVSAALPRITGFAIKNLEKPIQDRFLKNASMKVFPGIKECLDMDVGPREAGGAQLKLVEVARGLERARKIQLKRIPDSVD